MDYQIRKEKKFRYIEEGKGPTLILLHGLFGALSNWIDVIEKFKKQYTVVIPLLPIYDLPLLSTNVKSISKFVHRFIIYKGYDNFTLIGNSLGGHVALVYVTQYPQHVHSLVLTGSSGLYENAMGGTFPRREDYNFIKQKVEYTFYDPQSATKELVDEVYEIINNRIKLARILSLAKSAIRHNMKNELQSIGIPTCLIWGRNDNITPPDVAEEFHKLLPCSDLFFIDECGHAPMMEQAQLFNDILEKWLTKRFEEMPVAS
jgi:pimeloyl-ACP methyl ester carboxylesterase